MARLYMNRCTALIRFGYWLTGCGIPGRRSLGDGVCIRSQRWYKRPENALSKAFAHVDWEIARTQIKDVIGWV